MVTVCYEIANSSTLGSSEYLASIVCPRSDLNCSTVRFSPISALLYTLEQCCVCVPGYYAPSRRAA